ncbi:MspA family porin [Gordonia sp. (in: high G+C Gram-positive bacteria)]|uniref:MspA family porin n=1 Tax=Gordonia sp. (in: high G+C Gram-positive bacteria) TaxID=84139 RepID=UPI003528A15F
MRKNLMRNSVIAGAIAAVGAASILSGAGEASALPNGFKSSTGIDGQKVTIKRTGERSRIMPSVANNGAGRAAAVSGTYKATLSKGTGHMTVGYLVGCQVDITGLQGGLSGSIGLAGGSLSGSVSVPLTPGQVAFINSDAMSIKKGKATLMVDNFYINVEQCGGYASARSVVRVMAAEGMSTDDDQLSGDSGFVQTTLYGAPFSLG